MIKRFLSIVLELGLTLTSSQVMMAQELQAVVSGGAYHQGSAGSISWSLGEVTTETLKAGDYIITQGFQQGRLGLTSVKEIPNLDFTISAYPNPTHDHINIEIIGEITNMHYAVFDINGRAVKSGEIIENPTQISFSDMSSAIYFVRIMQNGQELKTLRVVKN